MIFTETDLSGAYIIEIDRLEDERGFFGRTWDQKEFEKHGLNSKIVQCNISYNKEKGTLRGMHYQLNPFEEAKIIRCVKGKIYDVIIDIRPESKNFKKWFGVELTENNYKMIYIPEGFAHGFQSLVDKTEVFYQMTQLYMKKYARGIKWNDEDVGIKWPMTNVILSKRDSQLPTLNEQLKEIFNE